MIKFRKYIAVGGTVACALGIGFFMQNGREVPSQAAPTLQPVAVQASVLPRATPDVAARAPEVSRGQDLNLGEVVLTAATPATDTPRVLPELPKRTRPVLGREFAAPDAPADPATPQLGCSVLAQATEMQAATARLTIAASCYPNERITVHHNGMMFTDATDDTGNLTIDIPALAEHAVFIVAFANGKGAVAQAHVPSIAGYDRVALQWSGQGGFQIHAREYGAGYGDQGHVWFGSARTSLDADNGTGGFVTRLGDADTLAPQMVEIYTFPTSGADKAGIVALSVESEVSKANCGRDVSAQILELRPNSKLKTRDLVLSVPDCDAVGDFLVLNNLVDDLKVAGK